jgi:hypothetical protein
MQVGQDVSTCCLTPDSTEYLALSENGLANLSRTPGYPTFLWLSRETFGLSLRGVLWVQVFLTSVTAALVAFLTAVVLPQYPRAAYAAGALSAVSFTGLTLSHLILSEAVFTPLVVLSVLLAYAGARTRRSSLMLLAAVSGGLAFLVKPVFLVWPAVLPVLLLMFAVDGRSPSSRVIALAVGVAVIFPVGWSLVNRARYGVLAPSSIGVAAGCVYLGGRTVATASDPGNREQIRAVRVRFATAARQFEKEADVYSYYSRCMKDAVFTHPRAAWIAYRASALEVLPDPFDPNELNFSANASTLRRGIRSIMARMSDLVYVFAFLGALRLLAAGRLRVLIGFIVMFVAVWLPTALSHAQGARLMYPVEPILLLFAAVGIELLFNRSPGVSASADALAAA